MKVDKATESSIEISWVLPSVACSGSIKEIIIEFKELPAGASKLKKLSETTIKATIEGLSAGKDYEIMVIIVDRANEEARTTPLTQKTSSK